MTNCCSKLAKMWIEQGAGPWEWQSASEIGSWWPKLMETGTCVEAEEMLSLSGDKIIKGF